MDTHRDVVDSRRSARSHLIGWAAVSTRSSRHRVASTSPSAWRSTGSGATSRVGDRTRPRDDRRRVRARLRRCAVRGECQPGRHAGRAANQHRGDPGARRPRRGVFVGAWDGWPPRGPTGSCAPSAGRHLALVPEDQYADAAFSGHRCPASPAATPTTRCTGRAADAIIRHRRSRSWLAPTRRMPRPRISPP
jgi:hypothetical protein